MKKYLRIISSLTASIVPIAIIVYFAVPWNPITSITLTGSSSLQPLITAFSANYTQSDLIAQGGGSGFGIKSVVTKTTDIGLSSKDPYSTVLNATKTTNGFTKEDWDSEGVKTFTIAFDNIGIIYKTKDNSKVLNIDKTSIQSIYKMFAGLESYKISDLIPNSSDDDYFIPYSRTGGAAASGTCTSFISQYSQYDLSSETEDQELIDAYNILKTGQYQGNVRYTNESNVETWNKISDENYDGAITYLSLSFILENYDTITKAGYSVATVNDQNPYQIYQENNNQLDSVFLKEYGWFYPYNIMVSTINASSAIQNFIDWIYFDQESQNIINSLALVGVGDNQDFLQSMLVKSDGTKYNDGEITDENFISVFFNSKYTDGALISDKNNWPTSWSFGIPNQIVSGQNQN